MGISLQEIDSRSFFLKNFVKWFGIIAIVAVIGFSMVSCGEDAVGTIKVTNDSALYFDSTVNGVKVQIYQDGAAVQTIDKVQSTKVNFETLTGLKEAVFSGVPVGDFQIWVIDQNSDRDKAVFKSKTFTLAKDETQVFSYNGSAINKK